MSSTTYSETQSSARTQDIKTHKANAIENTDSTDKNVANSQASFIHWSSTATQVFRKAPFKIFTLSIAMMVVAGLFQVLPAPYGVVISKFIGAMLIPLFWLMLDQLFLSGKFSFASLKTYSGYRKLPAVAIVLMLPALFQLLTANLLLSDAGTELILYGAIDNVTALDVAIIFASAAPIMTLLMFVPALVFVQQKSTIAAVKSSISMVCNAGMSMLLILVLNALVLFTAPYTFALSGVILGPWLACLNYAAYVHIVNKK